MSNTIKTFFIIILGIITFSGNAAFADLRPTFENQQVDVLEDGIVRFKASFNSNNNPYFPTDQPLTWFVFGENINNLRHETPRQNRIKGEYVVSQGATLFQEDTIYYVQSLMLFENELTEGEIISFDPYTPDPVVLNDQQITATNVQNQASNTGTSSNTSSNNTSFALQPPLNYSFNLSNFSPFKKTEPELIKQDKDSEPVKEERKEEEDISLFPNSATNSQNFDNTLSQNNDTNINKVGLEGNGLTASVAGSGVATPLLTYLTVFVLVVMIAISIFLWRFTNKKKRRLFANNVALSGVNNYPQKYGYNENNYSYIR